MRVVGQFERGCGHGCKNSVGAKLRTFSVFWTAIKHNFTLCGFYHNDDGAATELCCELKSDTSCIATAGTSNLVGVNIVYIVSNSYPEEAPLHVSNTKPL